MLFLGNAKGELPESPNQEILLLTVVAGNLPEYCQGTAPTGNDLQHRANCSALLLKKYRAFYYFWFVIKSFGQPGIGV